MSERSGGHASHCRQGPAAGKAEELEHFSRSVGYNSLQNIRRRATHLLQAVLQLPEKAGIPAGHERHWHNFGKVPADRRTGSTAYVRRTSPTNLIAALTLHNCTDDVPSTARPLDRPTVCPTTRPRQPTAVVRVEASNPPRSRTCWPSPATAEGLRWWTAASSVQCRWQSLRAPH